MPEATLSVIFLTSLLVGFSGALSPGPLLILDIREAMRRGFWAGPLISLGHAILELGVVVGLYLGLSRYLREGPAVAAVALAGGLFLLWMAWGLLRNPGQGLPSLEVDPPASGPSRLGPVVGGALVSLSNPFWAVWWATLGVTYLVWAQKLGAAGLASFYVGHIVADLSWYSAVALAVASGRRVLGDRAYRVVMVACGVSLLGLAGYFLTAGVRALLA